MPLVPPDRCKLRTRAARRWRQRAHYVGTGDWLRAMYSRRQLYEVMVEFWTNHFNVNLDDTWADHFVTVDNREVARAHALEQFSPEVRLSEWLDLYRHWRELT